MARWAVHYDFMIHKSLNIVGACSFFRLLCKNCTYLLGACIKQYFLMPCFYAWQICNYALNFGPWVISTAIAQIMRYKSHFQKIIIILLEISVTLNNLLVHGGQRSQIRGLQINKTLDCNKMHCDWTVANKQPFTILI